MRHIEIDRLADQPPQQHLQIREHVVELQGLRPQRLTPREGEKLTHEPGRPVRVLLDLHDVLEGRVGRPVVGEEQVGIADDCGEHVVEVVGDAAGELTDRLHFLALRQILLQRALLGRVEGEDGGARSLVHGRVGGRDKEPRGSLGGSGPLQQNVEWGDFALSFRCGVERGAQLTVVPFGDDFEDRRPGAGAVRLEDVRSQPRKGGVGAEEAARCVHGRYRDRRRVENPGEPHLGHPEMILACRFVRRAIDDNGTGRAGRTVCSESDFMKDAGRDETPVPRLEIDVELMGGYFAWPA